MAENETLATKQFCDWERNYIIRPHHDNLANKEEKKKSEVSPLVQGICLESQG